MRRERERAGKRDKTRDENRLGKSRLAERERKDVRKTKIEDFAI